MRVSIGRIDEMLWCQVRADYLADANNGDAIEILPETPHLTFVMACITSSGVRLDDEIDDRRLEDSNKKNQKRIAAIWIPVTAHDLNGRTHDDHGTVTLQPCHHGFPCSSNLVDHCPHQAPHESRVASQNAFPKLALVSVDQS